MNAFGNAIPVSHLMPKRQRAIGVRGRDGAFHVGSFSGAISSLVKRRRDSIRKPINDVHSHLCRQPG